MCVRAPTQVPVLVEASKWRPSPTADEAVGITLLALRTSRESPEY